MRFLLFALVAAGCSHAPDDWVPTLNNPNRGEQQNLTFFADPAGTYLPVDTHVRFRVRRFPVVERLCFRGQADGECMPSTGPSQGVSEILVARCEGPSCSASIDDTDEVSVIGGAPGHVQLHVLARLADGSIVADSTSLDFGIPDHVTVRCARDEVCPGRDALLVDATLNWDAVLVDANGRVFDVTPNISVEGPETLSVTPFEGHLLVWARREGEATLTVSALTFERRFPIKVVSLWKAHRAEVFVLPANPASLEDDLFAVPMPPWHDGSLDLVVGLTLGDGTRAISTADVSVYPNAWAEKVGALDSPMIFHVRQVNGCRAESIRIMGGSGIAKVDTSFVMQCP